MATDRTTLPTGTGSARFEDAGEPSRAEVQQRISALYDRAETDSGTFNATRAMSKGNRRTVTTAADSGRGASDPSLEAVTRQWFDVARSRLGPTTPASLPADRRPPRPAPSPRQQRPAGSDAVRELEAAAGGRLELEAGQRRTPELTGRAVAALPAAPASRPDASEALLPVPVSVSAPAALPAAAPAPAAPRSALRTSKEQIRRKLATAREVLARAVAQPSAAPPALEARPAERTRDTGESPAADTWAGRTTGTWAGQASGARAARPTGGTAADASGPRDAGGLTPTAGDGLTAAVPGRIAPEPVLEPPVSGFPAPETGLLAASYGMLTTATPTAPEATRPTPEFSFPAPEATPSAPGFFLPVPETPLPAPESSLPTSEAASLAPGFFLPVTEAPLPAPEFPLPTSEAASLAPEFFLPVPETPLPAPEFPLPTSEAASLAPGFFLPVTEAPLPAPESSLPAPEATPPAAEFSPSSPRLPSPAAEFALPVPDAPSPTTGLGAVPAPAGATAAAYGPAYLGKADRALAFARAQIGRPCVSGATGPESYDCSSLTQAAWRAAGVTLPRTSLDQARAFPRVGLDELQPGDLVFFHDDLSHTGLCTGDGLMIHAPGPGAPIREESVHGLGEGALRGAVRPA
ncbi:NlpC/P60 family protein [Streptomyces sp. NPDC017936]|uniref:C40 family peptidase n=1 Tax=Streptomyces sp. NPDC017936 TaxID=3365016 RepID=UPI00379E9592